MSRRQVDAARARWETAVRNEKGWVHYWDVTLAETWGLHKVTRPLPRNAPSRGVRPHENLATLDRRGTFLPLEAYDVYVVGEHPRATVARLQEVMRTRPFRVVPHTDKLFGNGPTADVAYAIDADGEHHDVGMFYPPELALSQSKLGEAVMVQESGTFAHPSEPDATNFASIAFADGRTVIASAVDPDKSTKGLARYTTVAETHRGRGLATKLWTLIHDCGMPAWRLTEDWHRFEQATNQIQGGMLRPLMKAHALCIMRAHARGAGKVRTDVMASAYNWEQETETLMAKAEATKAAKKQALRPGWPGMKPLTAAQKKANAARRKARAERVAAKQPRNQTRGRAPRPGRGVSVDAAKAVTEVLQAATADAREVIEELSTLLESLPPDAADLFASMSAAASEEDETVVSDDAEPDGK